MRGVFGLIALVLTVWFIGAFLICAVWAWFARWNRQRPVSLDEHANHPSVMHHQLCGWDVTDELAYRDEVRQYREQQS